MKLEEELQNKYMLQQYDHIMPTVISLLRDYRGKLEVDDYDSHAVDKMKKTQAVLDRLVSLHENRL